MDIALKMVDKYGQIIIREPCNGGGVGNLIFKKKDNQWFKIISRNKVTEIPKIGLTEVISSFERESISKRFIITKLLNLKSSPSSLFEINHNVNFICSSTQILNSQGSYAGFEYPLNNIVDSKLSNRILAYTKILAEKLKDDGYKGVGNIDWMISENDELYAAENNNRRTAILPQLTLIRDIFNSDTSSFHFPRSVSVYSFDNVFHKGIIKFNELHDILSRKNLLFRKETGVGIIITLPPFNFESHTYFGVLSVGRNRKETLDFYDKMTLNLNNMHSS